MGGPSFVALHGRWIHAGGQPLPGSLGTGDQIMAVIRLESDGYMYVLVPTVNYVL